MGEQWFEHVFEDEYNRKVHTRVLRRKREYTILLLLLLRLYAKTSFHIPFPERGARWVLLILVREERDGEACGGAVAAAVGRNTRKKKK